MNYKEHRSEEVRSQGCSCHGREVISLLPSPTLHTLLSVPELGQELSVSHFLVINVTCIFSFTSAHYLCHCFTVNTRAKPGQRVCVNGKSFLIGDCEFNKINYFDLLGNETHVPHNEGKEMKDTFEDVADILR